MSHVPHVDHAKPTVANDVYYLHNFCVVCVFMVIKDETLSWSEFLLYTHIYMHTC